MSVTIKDVAAAAGVSTATVSHVFNETRFVAEETKERVMRTAEEMGYIPSISASSLRSNKSKRIGLLVPSISSFFSVDILDAVEQVLRENGYQVILGCSHENLQNEKTQVDFFNYQQIDGLLMFPAPGDHRYLDQMSRKYPIVFIDREADNCERDLYLGGNEQASYEIVCQMIQEGHRRIGIINGLEGISAVRERFMGYRRALEDHGIPFDKELVQNGSSTRQGGYQAAERLIQDKEITGIVVVSPIMMIGCLKCLKDHGILVPQRIALVSFGDPEWAQITDPPLTAIWHPLLEMGQMAAKKLLERLEEEKQIKRDRKLKRKDYETVRLPMQIIRRKSF